MPENVVAERQQFDEFMKRLRNVFLLLNLLTVLLVLYLLGKSLSLTLIDRYEILGLVFITIACVITCVVQLCYMYKTAVESRKRLEELSILDPLTNSFNHSHLEKRLQEEISRCERYNRTASVVYFQINGFTMLNDLYGRDSGDEVLVQLAKLLKEYLRDTDIVGRMGGGEFVAILPETNQTVAEAVKKRILNAIENRVFHTTKHKEGNRITCSAGVAEIPDGENSAADILLIAHRAAEVKAKPEADRIVI